MPVEVSFHDETFEKFFKPVDQSYPGLSDDLRRDFIRYIESDRESIPDYFGRDVPYLQPELAAQVHLMHIHILIKPDTFPRRKTQLDRVCPRDPQRDAALVYVQGELEENRYCLLAFFWPDAHGKARDKGAMNYLARLAKRFRDEN